MHELTLTIPALLFPAVSLILLAYTNRFLSYAQLIRSLSEQFRLRRSPLTEGQIRNLRRRLYLTRTMQALGIGSLFLCAVTMFCIYVGWHAAAGYIFGAALVAFIASLGVSLVEIQISVRALELHLRNMKHTDPS